MPVPFSLENSVPLVQAVFGLHLLLTVFMTGLIWFVQVVHYPLFRQISGIEFSNYHRLHTELTTWVVALPMLLEAATAGGLIFLSPNILSSPLFLSALGLLAAIWISTGLLQASAHRKLRHDQDAATIRFLVRSNWIRTICWSLRTLLLSAILFEMYAPQPAG